MCLAMAALLLKPKRVSRWEVGLGRGLIMRVLLILALLLVTPFFASAQTNAERTNSSAKDSAEAAELKSLREALAQTQKQLEKQRQEIEALKQRSKAEGAAPVPREKPSAAESATPIIIASATESSSYTNASGKNRPRSQESQKKEEQ